MRYFSFYISLAILFFCSCTNKNNHIKSDSPSIQNVQNQNIKNIIAQNNKIILRDNWGVPHIYGKSDADVAFGLAYANAQDDFYTIQETVLN